MAENKIQEDAISAEAPLHAVHKIAKLRLIVVFLVNVLILWFWISEIDSLEDIFPIAFGLLFLFISLRMLILLIYNFNFKVVVSENDISYTLRGITSVIPWKDIKNLWRKEYKHSVNFIPVINIRNLNIEDSGGKIYKLSGLLNKYKDLSEMIVIKFANDRFSDLQKALENGETLNFGPFALSNTKISHKEKKYAHWQELGGVQFWQGSTYIKNAGSGKGDKLFASNNWMTIGFWDTWKIPNYDLMLMMISYNTEKNRNSIVPEDAGISTDKRDSKKWYDDQERAGGLVLLIIGLIVGWFGVASPIIDAINYEASLFVIDELVVLFPPLFLIGILYLIFGQKIGKVFSGNRGIILIVFMLIIGFVFLFIFNNVLSFLGYT